MDRIAEWYFHDYVELSTQQNRILKTRLDAIHYWHRNNELVKYRSQLIQFSEDLNQLPISTDKWLMHLDTIYMHWQRLREKASSHLSQLAPLLSTQQVDQLFAYLEQKNQHRLDEFNAQTQQEYDNNDYQKIIDSLEERLGSVTIQQRAFVKYFVQNTHVTQVEYVTYSREYQRELKTTFTNLNSQNLRLELKKLLNKPERFRPPEYTQKSEENRQLTVQMLYRISATLTQKQLVHLRTEIDDLIELLDKLIAD